MGFVRSLLSESSYVCDHYVKEGGGGKKSEKCGRRVVYGRPKSPISLSTIFISIKLKIFGYNIRALKTMMKKELLILGLIYTRHFCTQYCDKNIFLSHRCLKTKVSS